MNPEPPSVSYVDAVRLGKLWDDIEEEAERCRYLAARLCDRYAYAVRDWEQRLKRQGVFVSGQEEPAEEGTGG